MLICGPGPKACRTAARWPDTLSVAINIAPAQFKDGRLFETLRAALKESGLAATRLELEVTETVLLPASGDAPTQLAAIRALGCHIAMDDFGTGYSSLSRLGQFPFDRIKIDRSFIRAAGQLSRPARNSNAGNPAWMIRAIAALGTGLGVATLAEGVETPAQAGLVREAGVTEMQGYLISRAVPAAMVPSLIARLDRAVPTRGAAE
jgi:EAL domain-containing protein (putative c-di-GMP-specific phosphodiesterase class I)